MNDMTPFQGLEVGYDIPALPGMAEARSRRPACPRPRRAGAQHQEDGRLRQGHGMRHRVHGKMHKSVDVAKLQVELGGACGVCCQKVSEAEVFARGGIKDVLVSNQVRDPAKIDRLARMPKLGARTICCVDDVANVADLSAAAQKHGTEIECLVEIDCGAGRCGVTTTPRWWNRQGHRRRPGPQVRGHPGLPGRDAAHGQLRGPQGQDRHRGRHGEGRRRHAEGQRGSSATSSAAAAPAPTISRAPRASTTSFSAGPTPSWMPTMAASSTRTASASTRASGRTRCSS
jgi:hypothetical protein